MDDLEKMQQQQAALAAKIAATIAARKKEWKKDSEKRLAMVGAWLLKVQNIPLDGGLEEMPMPFVATLTEKQKEAWAKPWERKTTPKPQEAEKPATPAPTLPDAPKEAPAPRVAAVSTELKVSMAEKDEAKALGARWNAEGRFWYVPAGLDLVAFEKWL